MMYYSNNLAGFTSLDHFLESNEMKKIKQNLMNASLLNIEAPFRK